MWEPPAPPSPTLPNHHVLRAHGNDVACGVIDNGTAACHIGEHGFVLTASEPTLF